MSDRTYRKRKSSTSSHASHASSSSISLSTSTPHGVEPFDPAQLSPAGFAARSPTVPNDFSAFPSRRQAGAAPPAMSQRGVYHQPSTPVFTLESDGTAAASSPPTRHHFVGDGSPRLSPGALPVHHSSTRSAPGDKGYFPEDEKYPPGSTQANGSSVRIPLLVDDSPRHSLDVDRTPRGGAAGSSTWWPVSSRARLHPIMLIPSFVIGVFLAMSGLFGPTMSRDSPTAFNDKSVSSSAADYTLHKSGHLYLNPSSLDPSSVSYPLPQPPANAAPRSVRHPILDLINNATKQWEDKLARQSKTLEEAVREYKRRHGRKPPRGFDDWFRFAQTNKVILIDEFDQTFTDVLPFYAMPPSMLQNRSEALQRDPSTFTMNIKNGEVSITGAHKDDGRAKDQAALMKRWVQWVPDVNVTMSAHDGPSIMMDDRGRSRHVEAAKKGVYLTQPELDGVNEDAALWGFPLACPPNSRLRRTYDGLEIGSLPAGPSYIADHLKTMDMCENPEWQYLHGFTSWPGARPQILKPLFSFAKTTMHSDMLLTPLEQYWDYEQWDPVWEKKLYNRAVWRGTTTGVWFDRGTWWRSSQRVRLWFMSHDKIGSKLVRFDGTKKASDGTLVEAIAEHNVSTSALMERYVDFAFTGKAGQCSEEDGSCGAVRDLIDFQPTFGWNQANEYKYLLDIDGNAWSGRFHRLLSSNSAVLKTTIFPEWYAGWIVPWVHYIPIKVDYTDLFDVMAFFSGGLEGHNAHDDLAKKIADQGKEYTVKHWRYADMEAYFFRLALEWARCSSPDRAAMDYDGPGA
ncbi:hypothetical protein BCR35DRAFT_350444 [Leucosporidium creatinivorum]|uniref:Glycosyl transferase CAP10 domain-containing protein n=1 Tax=Leucosporidium creatinivorum TaxID=106004 RepID=A0A1Y2G1R2_9BASI|nr:hypothetical protein BCR35DRAFT_350444 [Leucosporidium creatinivorum]